MYELRQADENDIQLLIKYKLSTIFQFANDISSTEEQQIIKYVDKNVPALLSNYKIVVVNKHNIGCLLVTDYENGVMLDEIYLEEEYRGLGIGSSLLENILDKHNVVYLWVYKKNDKAIKLYKKFGFTNIEETETRYLMKFEIEKTST